MNLLALDRMAGEATGGIIDQVPAGLFGTSTPCTQWTVRQVVKHMVDNNRFFASKAGEESTVEDGLTFHATTRKFTAIFSKPEARALRIHVPRLRETFDGNAIVAIHFVDVLVHGWDIGRAAGLDVTLNETLATAALRIASRYPDTPTTRGPGGAFAAQRAVPDTAPVQDRLLALLGRDPDWAPLA